MYLRIDDKTNIFFSLVAFRGLNSPLTELKSIVDIILRITISKKIQSNSADTS